MSLIYQFDWDPSKEANNIRKHRVSFQQASSVFRDPSHISIFDEDHSEDEDRWITIGIDKSGILRVVVHTFNAISEEVYEIRIISARKATIAEAEVYYEGI